MTRSIQATNSGSDSSSFRKGMITDNSNSGLFFGKSMKNVRGKECTQQSAQRIRKYGLHDHEGELGQRGSLGRENKKQAGVSDNHYNDDHRHGFGAMGKRIQEANAGVKSEQQKAGNQHADK